MKQIEVQILQQSYLLSCPEGHESRLLDAVERVDTAMTRLRDGGKVRSRERIAVLTALNLAFEVVDHEAKDLAAQASAQATPPPAIPAHPIQEDAWSHSEHLQTLVQRLDEALGDDGRLL